MMIELRWVERSEKTKSGTGVRVRHLQWRCWVELVLNTDTGETLVAPVKGFPSWQDVPLVIEP